MSRRIGGLLLLLAVCRLANAECMWLPLFSGLQSPIDKVVIVDSQTIYVTTNEPTRYPPSQILRRSDDGGVTWTAVYPQPGRGQWAGNLAVSRSNPIILYNYYFRSEDSGQTWKGNAELNEIFRPRIDFKDADPLTVAVSADNPDRVIFLYREAGTIVLADSFVMYSEDGGSTWRSIAPKPDDGTYGADLRFVHPTTGDAFLTYGHTWARWLYRMNWSAGSLEPLTVVGEFFRIGGFGTASNDPELILVAVDDYSGKTFLVTNRDSNRRSLYVGESTQRPTSVALDGQTNSIYLSVVAGNSPHADILVTTDDGQSWAPCGQLPAVTTNIVRPQFFHVPGQRTLFAQAADGIYYLQSTTLVPSRHHLAITWASLKSDL